MVSHTSSTQLLLWVQLVVNLSFVGLGSTDTLLNYPLAPQETQHDFSLRKVQLEKCLSLSCPGADPEIVIRVQVVYLGGEENTTGSESGKRK